MCPGCGAFAFGEQAFCGRCGLQRLERTFANEASTEPAPPESPVVADRRSPIPRSLLVGIAPLFLLLGGLAALVAKDVRSDSHRPPSPPPVAFGLAADYAGSDVAGSDVAGSDDACSDFACSDFAHSVRGGTRPMTRIDCPNGGLTRASIHRVEGTTQLS